MIHKKKRVLLLSLVIFSIFCFIPLNVAMTTQSDLILKDQKNMRDYQNIDMPYSQDLEILFYGDWVGYYWIMSGNDEISWSFSGTNTYVGIKVMVMDSANYNNFYYGYSYTYYLESSGDYYADSGTFTIPYSDTWYIIFANYDSDQESTALTYSASKTSNYFGGSLINYGAWGYSYFINSLDEASEVEWSFTGTNHYVGITAMAMDESEYAAFSSGYSYYYYSLSNGDYFSDSGVFTVPYSNIWYFVFLNNDPDELPTDLIWSIELLAPPDDVYEENDNIGSAKIITEGYYSSLVCNDDDWFKIYIENNEIIEILLEFSTIDGDINLELYDPSQNLISSSYSSTDNEFISYKATLSGYYYIHIDDYEPNPHYDMTISISIADDEYEENDDFDSAPEIYEGYYPNLVCFDDDFYRIYLEDGEIIEVLIEFYNSEGDIDLGLYDPNKNLVSSSTSTTDNEYISYQAEISGYYYIQIDEYEPNPHYDLTVSITSGDDAFEDNDDYIHATLVVPGSYYDLCAFDEDWYKISLDSNSQIVIDLLFSNLDGDIDMVFTDSSANILAQSNSTSDNEHIEAIIDSSGMYYILIYAIEPNPNYSMQITVTDIGSSDDTATDDTTSDDTATDDTTSDDTATDDTTSDDTTSDDTTSDDTTTDDLKFDISNIPGYPTYLFISVIMISISLLLIKTRKLK
ncbi:MAG: hypothetical protein K9W44_10000 [Candidatus Lokiarchaeota archaeon]|nr:hypothetical protein [Candidatus Harpocratesius repetitus]